MDAIIIPPTDQATSTPRRGRGKSRKNLELIQVAAEILQRIWPATIRAVCYQLFVLKVISSMAKLETNKVSVQLRDAREAGVIPWEWIVDETREAEVVRAWEDPAAYVETVKRAYRRDRWQDQPNRLEVWSEKGTVRGTLAPILQSYGLTFRVMHGYGSATTLHQVAQESLQDPHPLSAFYVGDWDPSGLHMSEVDLPARLHRYEGRVRVQRLALDRGDVHDGNLPSFAAESKRGDPRYRWFVERYGTTCWELDAMSPVDLRERVEDAIVRRLDRDAWRRAEVTEAAEIESISSILSRWPGISGQASEYSDGGRQ
ncbi:MAG: hypothetical protein ACE148_14455 [Vicinamibacterales bacterium]